MLDGLDEVADPEVRGKVIAWAEQQMSIHGDNRFIVTSRRHGYPESGMGEVTVLDIRPFTGEQVRSFVHKWYLADQIKSQGRDDPGVRRDAEDGADDLLRRLFANPALSDLAVNPLLLTMISMVHRSGRALPGNRAELYAEICEVSLGKRQQAKGVELDLTPAQKQAVLEPLAWYMMETLRKREIPADEAATVIAEPLRKVDPRTAPRDFLVSVEQSSSLLLEREGGVYAFAHPTFQEFLAACHAQQAGLVDRIVQRVSDPWWRETLRLYAARSDATPILRACMAGVPPDPSALALALECREEAKGIAPEVRANLDRFVEAGLDEMDPERRRPVAEALLKVRLGRLRRLDENRYIDPELISHAEYQLFLDEMRAKGEHRQPDHWKGIHFAPGEARKPTVGLRFSDALAFCDWLTEREGGGWRFRPPTAEEEADVEATTGAIDVMPWRLASADGRAPEPWPASLPPARDPAWRKEVLVKLSRARARDCDLAGALDNARGAALNLARGLDPARGGALDLALARFLARDLALARDLDRPLDLDRDLDRPLDLDLDHALDRTLARARNLALDPALALDGDHARDRRLDLALMLFFIIELAAMVRIVRYRSAEPQQIDAVEVSFAGAPGFFYWLMMFARLIASRSDDRIERIAPTRTAWSKLAKRFVAGVPLVGRLLLHSDALYEPKAGVDDGLSNQLTSLFTTVYFALAFKRARLRGEDEPFEALRIVRERADPVDISSPPPVPR